MTADLLISGGTLVTMDPARPTAEAVALRAGRIIAVGDAASVRAAVGRETRHIDLAGGTLTPGLVDGHCHLYGLGRTLEALRLRGVASEPEAAQAVARAAAGRGADEWIVGHGWDQNLWTPAVFPGHASLDAAAPGRPVALRRIDGHALWASQAALVRAGVTRATGDPPGGKIVRDRRGEPTGVLIDAAAELVARVIPRDTPATRERMILAAIDEAVARGLTGVHEMDIDDTTVAVYRQLAAEGRLKLRVYAFLGGEGGALDSLAERPPDHDRDGSAYFTLRGVKLYADGALGSRGALMLAPYTDDPASCGLELTSAAELAHAAQLAARSGWQLAVHAIGDRASRQVLDAFAPLGGRDLRFRVEHAQIVAAADLPRFAPLGVVAAMQPTHATSDMGWAESRLGAERLRGAYAWQTLVASGAHVVGGSDFPIEEVAPLHGLHAAVSRQDAAGRPAGGWYPEERLSLAQALGLYTVEPAWASFVDGRRGVIAVGAVADFTWLDRELRPDRSLLDARVVATIVGGHIVYDART